MTAALIQQQRQRHDGLQPIRLARDLGQIADLIELCFADQMDSGGRAAVQEMKFMAGMGPLLWLFALLGLRNQYGLGYVWREDGRVVGNASLYPAGAHPSLGRGWLVANVTVHPDYRRRGIARAMMRAILDLARRQRGRWILLQVEADNQGAVGLYDSLGFEHYETLSHWKARRNGTLPPAPPGIWGVRPRKSADGPAEVDLIFNRARTGAMTWTRPLSQGSVQGGWTGSLDDLLEGSSATRLVMPDPLKPGRLLGSAWVSVSGWQQARVSLFIDPALDDPNGRLALLYHTLNNPLIARRTISVEIVAGDAVIEEALQAAGFEPVRHLIQMRKIIPSEELESAGM